MKKHALALSVVVASVACLTLSTKTDVTVDVADTALAAYEGSYPAQLVLRTEQREEGSDEVSIEHHRLAVICDDTEALSVRRDVVTYGCAIASTARAAIVPLVVADGEEAPACGALAEAQFVDAADVEAEAFGEDGVDVSIERGCNGTASLALE